jgi:hypothetical protein
VLPLRVIGRMTATRAIHWKRVVMLAAIAAAFLAIPALAHVPARLVTTCAKWIGLAVALELLSMLGFVLVSRWSSVGGWACANGSARDGERSQRSRCYRPED